MNLSDIRSHGAPVAAWFYPTGRNGHVLGRGGVAHAWLVERGAPPTVTDGMLQWQRQNTPGLRRWWQPYNQVPHEQFRTPLCQNLRTTARGGRLQQIWYERAPHCLECEQIVDRLGAPPIREVIQQDPWMMIQQDARPTTIDPVSGL